MSSGLEPQVCSQVEVTSRFQSLRTAVSIAAKLVSEWKRFRIASEQETTAWLGFAYLMDSLARTIAGVSKKTKRLFAAVPWSAFSSLQSVLPKTPNDLDTGAIKTILDALCQAKVGRIS